MFACFLTFLYPSQIELARTLWRFLLRICFGHCVVFQDGCRCFGHFPNFLTKCTWWFSNLYNWTLVHALTETGRGRFSTNGAAGNTSPTVLLLNVNIQSIDHVKRYNSFLTKIALTLQCILDIIRRLLRYLFHHALVNLPLSTDEWYFRMCFFILLFKSCIFPQKQQSGWLPPSDCPKCGKDFDCKFNQWKHLSKVHWRMQSKFCMSCDRNIKS